MNDNARMIRFPDACHQPHGNVEMLLVPGEWVTAVETMLRHDDAKYHWMQPDMRLHHVALEYLRRALREELVNEGIMKKGEAQS